MDENFLRELTEIIKAGYVFKGELQVVTSLVLLDINQSKSWKRDNSPAPIIDLKNLDEH